MEGVYILMNSVTFLMKHDTLQKVFGFSNLKQFTPSLELMFCSEGNSKLMQ